MAFGMEIISRELGPADHRAFFPSCTTSKPHQRRRVAAGIAAILSRRVANAKTFAEAASAQASRWEKAEQEARTPLANAEQEMAVIDLLAAGGEDIDRILDNLNRWLAISTTTSSCSRSRPSADQRKKHA